MQTLLSSLSAQRRTILGERHGHAHERRRAVVHASDRIEILLQSIVGERLDHHDMAFGLERRTCMLRCAGRVGHVVEAIEEREDVVAAIVGGGVRALKTRHSTHQPLPLVAAPFR